MTRRLRRTTDIVSFFRRAEQVHDSSDLLHEVSVNLGEGTGWDVGWGAVYLASDESRWVTGHVLVIDAGLTATTR